MAFHVVILCGGEGTRLWPVSRAHLPKQFAPLLGETSLFAATVDRARQIGAASVTVVTAADQAHLCRLHRPEGLPYLIKAEPVGRNTLPAVIYGVNHLADEDTVLVMPSDHLVEDVAAFAESVRAAVSLAETGHIVTFGIQPSFPATGYGYIERGEPLGEVGFAVERFHEKPDEARAKSFLATGRFTWNSGMFAFSVATIRAETARHQPAMMPLFDAGNEVDPDLFGGLPSLSIDYGIAELSDRMAVIPAGFPWNDLGSWKSVWEELHDGDHDIATNDQTHLLSEDCERLLVYSDRGSHKLYATLGLEELAVVDTADALLIAPLGRCQEVRRLRDRVAEVQPLAVTQPAREVRPWGSFEILQEAPGYKVKRLIVKPGHRLSLQSHERRTEHWVVVRGTATVVNGEREFALEPGGSTMIPLKTVHRLGNLGDVDVEVIEVQTGDYLGEDDITRYQDDFDRIAAKT